jgi:hypothetical protein
MLVHNGTIDMNFYPVNPGTSLATGQHNTFEAVSLGDRALRGSELQIVSKKHSANAKLTVQASRAKDGITFRRLRLGPEELTLEIGRDTERAIAYANGSSIYNYDLIDAIQKNPVLAAALSFVVGTVLWPWVRKTLFPNSGD